MTKSFVVLLILLFVSSLTKGQIDIEQPFTKCWSLELNEFNSKIFASDNDNVYTISENKILSVSKKGEINWRLDFDGNKFEPKQIVINKDFLQLLNEDKETKRIFSYTIGLESGLLIKKEAVDNNSLLEKIDQEAINLETIIKGSLKISVNVGNNLMVSDGTGTIYFVDKGLKKVIWKQKVGAEISQINVVDDDVYFSSNDNLIYKVKIQNGRRVWKKKVLGRNKFIVSNDKKYLVVSNLGEEYVFLVETSTGKIGNQFAIETSDYLVGSPILLGNDIIVPGSRGISLFSDAKCMNLGVTR